MPVSPTKWASEPPASNRRWLIVVLALLSLVVILIVIQKASPPSETASSPPVQPAEVKPGQTYEKWKEALQRRREAAAARRAGAATQPLPESESFESANSEPATWDVLESVQEGNLISALVRRPGPLPWLRVAAAIEVEVVEGVTSTALVGRQSLAADRMEVRLKEGAEISAINAWLFHQGAHLAARSGKPEVFDVIWDQPELQTLPRAVELLATQPEWFAHVQPVTAPFNPEVFNLSALTP